MRLAPPLCALSALVAALGVVAGEPCALVAIARAESTQANAQQIDALAQRTDAAATEALTTLVHDGLPDALTDRVLEALAKEPHPEALTLIAELTAHRRAGARVRAYRALAAITPSASTAHASADEDTVVALLVHGLDDSDSSVRAACAIALGARTASRALPALLQALARGVLEAGRAVGAVTSDVALPNVHAQLALAPMQARLDAYEALLKRADISEASKLDTIARIGEIASPAAKSFLQRLLQADAFGKSRALIHAATETQKRIADVPAKSKPR